MHPDDNMNPDVDPSSSEGWWVLIFVVLFVVGPILYAIH